MQRKYFTLLLALTLILTSCSPDELFGPTITPSQTITPTFTQTITSTSTPTFTSTLTNTFTPSPTATEVPLGGSEVGYMWDSDFNIFKSLPKGVTNILANPSAPEVWQQPTGLFYSDGTPLHWGEYFVDEASPQQILVNIPVLFRGVVEFPSPDAIYPGTIMLPVFEVPAQGGSNFIILFMIDAASSPTNKDLSYLTNGIPLTCKSSLDHPVDVLSFMAATGYKGTYKDKQIVDALQPYKDRVIIVTFYITGPNTGPIEALQQVLQGKLINGGSFPTEGGNPLIGVILPQKQK